MMRGRVRANQAIPKYRIYKGHRKKNRGIGPTRGWWKLAFMHVVIAQARTFEGVLWALFLERQRVKKLREILHIKSYP